MSHDFLLDGIMLSPIIPACSLALALTVLSSWALIRLRLYRLLWRRPLAELALFFIWLALVTTFSPIDGTR